MRFLVVDEWVPYPPDSGKKIRTYNLLRYLVRLGSVVYLCYGNGETRPLPGKLSSNITFIQLPDRRPRKGSLSYYGRVIWNCLQPRPFSAVYAKSRELVRELQRVLGAEFYDAVICEWTPYAEVVLAGDHAMPILMAHNIEFVQWRRLFLSARNPIVKGIAYLQWRKMYWYERHVFAKFRGMWVVSEYDKRTALSMARGLKVRVAENGVDVEYYKRGRSEGNPRRLVFSASMDAFSNEDAACYFVKDVLPLIVKDEPNIEFTILGRSPGRRVVALRKSRNVVVTGAVPDVRPHLARCGVAVVPLRIGGGTRLKILEAMAMGIPVVTTSVGAEGLNVTHDKHVLIADGRGELAREVVRCVRDDELRARLVRNSLHLVQAGYSWEGIGRKFMADLAALLGSGIASMNVHKGFESNSEDSE